MAGSAWTNQVQNQVIVGGANGRVLVYSGPPAAGNLIASIAGTAGTDPFGNAYLAGETSYGPGVVGTRLAVQLASFFITWYHAPHASGPWTATATISTNTSGSALVLTADAIALASQFTGSPAVYTLFPSGDTTGTTDFNNITSWLNAVTTLVLMPGTWYINQPIVLSTTGQSLMGLPAAPHKTSPAMPVVINLASGSNCDMIQVTNRNCYIGNLELNGNKGGQSSGTNALIYLPVGSDWSIIERCFLHDGFFLGIHGDSAQAHKILDCSIQNCGNRGIFLPSTCTDQTIRGTLIGSNTGDNIYTAAAVTHILDCDIFSSSANGITVDVGATGTLISNTGIDRNGQSGIVILTRNVSVYNCTLHSNGQAATNTYASVVVDNTSNPTTGVTIGGNTFWLDAGITNLPSYHIQYKNTATAKTHGNQFEAASFATGTISAASQVKDPNETG